LVSDCPFGGGNAVRRKSVIMRKTIGVRPVIEQSKITSRIVDSMLLGLTSH
jgi:hypothetical protein